jgi:cyclopropane-fatty-acyl-phospholipid synthase
MAIYSSVTGAVSSALSPITSQAWGPLVNLCKNGTLAQLQNLKHGKLVVFEGGSSKSSVAFGSDKEGLPIAFLDVKDDRFWVRLALFADMVSGNMKLGLYEQLLTNNRVLRKATCWERSRHQI